MWSDIESIFIDQAMVQTSETILSTCKIIFHDIYETQLIKKSSPNHSLIHGWLFAYTHILIPWILWRKSVVTCTSNYTQKQIPHPHPPCHQHATYPAFVYIWCVHSVESDLDNFSSLDGLFWGYKCSGFNDRSHRQIRSVNFIHCWHIFPGSMSELLVSSVSVS